MSELRTSAALADGVEALLAAHGISSGGATDLTALLKEAERAGWLDAVNLGLSGSEDLTVEDAFAICEIFGRRIAPISLLVAATLVKPLLHELGPNPFVERILRRLEGGAAVAVPIPRLMPSREAPQGVRFELVSTVKAEERGRGVLLTGSIDRMTDCCAETVLVPTRDRLLAVPLESPGVSVDAVGAVMLGHDVGRVRFESVLLDAEFVHRGPVAVPVHRAATLWSLALDAYAVGICRELVSCTVPFIINRRQFGQPIGAFQAVQHIAADMYIAAETSFCAFISAARAWLTDGDTALEQIAASRLHSAAAAVTTGEMAIQLHGGVGFTWDMGIHRWYRAAQFAQRYLTEETDLRSFLARTLSSELVGDPLQGCALRND